MSLSSLFPSYCQAHCFHRRENPEQVVEGKVPGVPRVPGIPGVLGVPGVPA